MSQKKAPLFEIRSGTVDALLLSPRTADMDALAAELTRRFADTPEFFSNDVIAIDVRRLAEDERLPIDRLVETLTALRARAIGVVASPEQAGWPKPLAFRCSIATAAARVAEMTPKMPTAMTRRTHRMRPSTPRPLKPPPPLPLFLPPMPRLCSPAR